MGVQHVRLDEFEFPDIVWLEEKFARDLFQHERARRLVGARDGPQETSAFQHHAVGCEVAVAQRPPVQAELGGLEKEAGPGQRVRAMHLEPFGDDAAVPAQPQLAEFDLPAVGAELCFHPSLQPVRQTDVIEEQAEDDDGEDEEQEGDAAPLERGEEGPPAQGARTLRRPGCFARAGRLG